MFPFGHGSRRPRQRLESLPGESASIEALREALRHILRLLVAAVRYAGGDAAFGRKVKRVEHELERATLPEDFEAIGEALGTLRLPFGLTPVIAASSSEVLARCVNAAVPVAEVLGIHGVADVLRSLAGHAGEGDPIEGADRYSRQMTVVAESAAFVRRTADVLRVSLADLVETLGPLAEDEPGVQARLRTIRERLAGAADLHEIEELRELLLDAATALVQEAQERSARAAAVGDRIAQAQDQVRALESALHDARTMASTDPLTGLGNRRALEAAAAQLARSSRATGLLVLDLDHFKRINDTHGHAVGDLVLQHVATAIRRELRGDDRAFRVGGEEFLVLLHDTPLDGGIPTAERLRRCIARLRVVHGRHVVEPTVSIGVTAWVGAEPFEAALKRADAALYAAKRAGRNRVWSPSGGEA